MISRRRTLSLLGAAGLAGAGLSFASRGAGAPVAPRAPMPGWPNVGAETAEFESEGVMLRGGFHAPLEGAPRAGLVLIHGAGAEPRMTGLGGIYGSQGYAVLTYDKRGAGESGGVYEGADNVGAANLRLLAADAAAAMAWASRHPALQGRPIGFAGFSQAGWIVPLAIAQGGRSDFVVMWSGPVCKVTEAMAFEARGGNPDPALAAYIEKVRTEGDVDSEALLRTLTVPGLWIWGGRDDIVPVDISRERLMRLIGEGHAFEHMTLPDSGHRLMEQEVAPTLAWLEAAV